MQTPDWRSEVVVQEWVLRGFKGLGRSTAGVVPPV